MTRSSLLAGLLGALALAAPARAAEVYGQPLKGLPAVPLAEVLAEPQAGRSVRLEGVIEKVCKNKGCWLALKQGERSVHVTFAGYAFFVPKDSAGRPALDPGGAARREAAAVAAAGGHPAAMGEPASVPTGPAAEFGGEQGCGVEPAQRRRVPVVGGLVQAGGGDQVDAGGFGEGDQVGGTGLRSRQVPRKLDVKLTPAVPDCLLASCLVDQDAAHGFRGRAEEMSPAVPMLHFRDIHQPHVRLVNQRRGLQRLPGLLLSHLERRQTAQFVIDEWQELLGRLGVASHDPGQDLCDIGHER